MTGPVILPESLGARAARPYLRDSYQASWIAGERPTSASYPYVVRLRRRVGFAFILEDGSQLPDFRDGCLRV